MIVVTGATGNVGSELITALVPAGEDARALARRFLSVWSAPSATSTSRTSGSRSSRRCLAGHCAPYRNPTRPRCSISRDPRREDHTTCTAVAPDVVFTVRMYGTRPLYGPRLMRKFSSHEPQPAVQQGALLTNPQS